ncbi:MAG TPA: hypothetical protein VIE46_03380, partial [Gemmatimonadales bacterium]
MRLPGDSAPPARPVDSATLARFRTEYLSAPAALPVFERYLPTLSAAAMIGFLEHHYPSCHARSHDLGKALFSASGDLGTALQECGTGCTSGCMHGVVAQAFGNEEVGTITSTMNRFCLEGEVARLYKPGNCAHTMGHALMVVTNGDVPHSIDGCLGFAQTPMAYYCASGVYMEKLVTGPRPRPAPPGSSVHVPCDSEPLFPAACYRYQGVVLVATLGDRDRAASECLRLDGPRRRGCFHGLGYAAMAMVFDQPETLAAACARGDREDRTACIEGTIEKVADVNEQRARAACGGLDPDIHAVCD